jgi:hypothetical protein
LVKKRWTNGQFGADWGPRWESSFRVSRGNPRHWQAAYDHGSLGASRPCPSPTTPAACFRSPKRSIAGSPRVAGYAEKIAATLERAGDALRHLEAAPSDRRACAQAVRELGRISGYIETMVGALEHHLDGRKLAGVKRRLELLRPGELHKSVVAGHKPIHLDRLASAEGYFRALADGLRM